MGQRTVLNLFAADPAGSYVQTLGGLLLAQGDVGAGNGGAQLGIIFHDGLSTQQFYPLNLLVETHQNIAFLNRLPFCH
jgi:hypothetical protein